MHDPVDTLRALGMMPAARPRTIEVRPTFGVPQPIPRSRPSHWPAHLLLVLLVVGGLGAAVVVTLLERSPPAPEPEPSTDVRLSAPTEAAGEGARRPFSGLSDTWVSDSVGSALIVLLRSQEGFRDTIYTDTRGKRTVGWGHNLEVPLPRPLGDLILDWDAGVRALQLERGFPQVHEMPGPVQVALLNMAFEVGPTGTLRFHDMLGALERRDWEAAAVAVEDSHFYRATDTRGRAEWVAGIFRQQTEEGK